MEYLPEISALFRISLFRGSLLFDRERFAPSTMMSTIMMVVSSLRPFLEHESAWELRHLAARPFPWRTTHEDLQ